jgi:transcriptional regulator with XRE-family HTH domain
MVEVNYMRLKELRRQNLMTQQDLEKASGVSRESIWRLEKGLSGARPSTLKKLGAALGIDPRELLPEQE